MNQKTEESVKESVQEVTRLPSISTKTVGFSAKAIRAIVEGKPGIHFLARAGGVALEYFSGESKHGEWHGFKGIFSLHTRDGRKYTSSAIYLPKNITDKVLDQFKHGVVEVEFYCDINVSESEKNASGYAFLVEPIASPEAEKKAAAITARVLGVSSQKLIAGAGKDTGEAEPDKTPVKKK